jgi:hypothetical protein
MCADDELHRYLFLFIHLTGKVFHIVLYPLILERISQVASTAATSLVLILRLQPVHRLILQLLGPLYEKIYDPSG